MNKETKISLFRRGNYFICAVCNKPHRKLSIFYFEYFNGEKIAMVPIFCSKECIEKIGFNFLHVIPQNEVNKDKDGFFGSLRNKWGNCESRRTGYHGYYVDEKIGQAVVIYHYIISSLKDAEVLINFISSLSLKESNIKFYINEDMFKKDESKDDNHQKNIGD